MTSTRSAGPPPLQDLDRLDHLAGVAHLAAQRLVHVGEQRPHRGAVGAPDADHGLGQGAGLRRLLHEGPPAHLHVEDQAVEALGQLLGHDRRGDQRDRLHRAGGVAQGVEAAVGRAPGSPTGRRAPGRCGPGGPGTRAGRGRCGSRGWSPACRGCPRCGPGPGPLIIGHRHPAGGDHGAEGDAHLVAHPAGGVLVHLGRGDVGEVEDVAGVQHGVDPGGEFLRRRAPP